MKQIGVTKPDSAMKSLLMLIGEMGGVGLVVVSSGTR